MPTELLFKKNALIFLTGFLLTCSANAQYTGFEVFSGSAALTVNAEKTLNLPVTDIVPLNHKVKSARLFLELNTGEDYIMGNNNFSADITVNLQRFKTGIGTSDPGAIVLHIDQSASEQVYAYDFTSLLQGNMLDQYKCTINVSTITADPIIQSRVNSGINLTLRYVVEFDIDVRVGSVMADKPVTSVPVIPTGGRIATFSWTGLNFPNYQFELLRLFNNQEVDWKKAMRIETQSNEKALTITIPEGTGKYLWRVRPIGTYYEGSITNDKNYGLWSEAPADGSIAPNYSGSGVFPFTDPENNDAKDDDKIDKNWIYSRTFTEDNKVTEQMVYADGLQKIRQTQTFLESNSTGKKRVVTQTVYDYSGRAAVNSLPVPMADQLNGYRTNFMKNSSTSIFNAEDFDEGNAVDNPATVISFSNEPFSYYSDNNSTEATIPGAEGFPYTRTMWDESGRIKEQSGVGKNMMIGEQTNSMGRTVRTFYSNPSDDELIRIFGEEAPLGNRVIKTETKDGNNTVSITYTSKDGRLLATCLTNAEDDNLLLPLDDETGKKMKVRNTVTENTEINRGFRSNKKVAFSNPTQVDIGYKIKCETLDFGCASASGNCQYDVQFFIHDLDNNVTYKSDIYDLSGGCQGDGYITIPDASGWTTGGAGTIQFANTRVIKHPACSLNDGEAVVGAAGGETPYTYLWGANSGNQSAATATGLGPGIHSVTVTDNTGCTSSTTLTLEHQDAPDFSFTITKPTNCNSDGSTAATVTGGTTPYSYLWSNAGTAETITGIAKGTYSLTVTGNDECYRIKQVAVEAINALQLEFTTAVPSTCVGNNGSATVIVSGGVEPYSYLWDVNAGSQTTDVAANLSAGEYTITVTDAASCTKSGTVSVKAEGTPLLSIDYENPVCGNSDGSASVSVQGSGSSFTYAWSSGGITAGETGLQAGNYTVTVTDNNGCSSSAAITLNNASTFALGGTILPPGNYIIEKQIISRADASALTAAAVDETEDNIEPLLLFISSALDGITDEAGFNNFYSMIQDFSNALEAAHDQFEITGLQSEYDGIRTAYPALSEFVFDLNHHVTLNPPYSTNPADPKPLQLTVESECCSETFPVQYFSIYECYGRDELLAAGGLAKITFEEYMLNVLQIPIADKPDFYINNLPGFIEGDFDIMIHRMLTEQYYTGPSVMDGGVRKKLNPDGTIGDPITDNNSVQYDCKALWDCWINVVAMYDGIRTHDGDPNISGPFSGNEIADAVDESEGDDAFDEFFNENSPTGGPKWLTEYIAKRLIRLRMRDLELDPKTITMNIPREFLNCAGYRFAGIVDQSSVTGNVLPDDITRYENTPPHIYEPGSSTKLAYPYVLDPKYAFKYFEYNGNLSYPDAYLPISKKTEMDFCYKSIYDIFGQTDICYAPTCNRIFQDWTSTERLAFYNTLKDIQPNADADDPTLNDLAYEPYCTVMTPEQIEQMLIDKITELKGVCDQRRSDFKIAIIDLLEENCWAIEGCDQGNADFVITNYQLEQIVDAAVNQCKNQFDNIYTEATPTYPVCTTQTCSLLFGNSLIGPVTFEDIVLFSSCAEKRINQIKTWNFVPAMDIGKNNCPDPPATNVSWWENTGNECLNPEPKASITFEVGVGGP